MIGKVEVDDTNKIYILGNVPSSKNSKTFTGRFLVNSKTVNKYLKMHGHQWGLKENKERFLDMLQGKEPPYRVHFYFIRDSKRKFDYINIAQSPQDLMVKHGWLVDDNCDCIVPIFDGYEVDKEKAGMYLWVE